MGKGTYYRDRRAGTFQHFVTVPAHTVLPLPTNHSFTSSACLGVAGLTAAMTLWQWLNVPIPSPTIHVSPITNENQETLLIWGGSTITGQFAIQLARLSGVRVIAVTSTRTASLARYLGAEVVTRDGKTNEEIVAEINTLSGNYITKAIDLVGPKTAAYCLQTFSTAKTGKKNLFAPLAMMNPKQQVPDHVEVVTVEMKQFVLDKGCRVYAEKLNELVEEKRIRLPEVVVLEGGLEAVEGGLERLKSGEMGGRKLVVRM
jgi:NADPH:quinone reductase-like Zn-dependent oxidoreductase